VAAPRGNDQREFWVQVTTAPLVAYDNIDAELPGWLLDEIAGTITGKAIEQRQLYTDAQKISRPTTAALAGTTRTAAFCRPDIAERTLPILTAEFDDDRRRSDADMAEEIRAQRDGLLSWAVATAAGLLARRRQAPEGLPLRFVDFARLVWAYAAANPCGTSAAQALLSLRQAQALTVGEADPLVEAVVAYIDKVSNDDGVWQGSASQLVKALSDAGAEIPYMGGGKVISRHLREAKRTLDVMGVRLSERQWNNTKMFILQHDLTEPLPGFSESATDDAGDNHDQPNDHKFSDPTIEDDDIPF
jgi:hypothetical protein